MNFNIEQIPDDWEALVGAGIMLTQNMDQNRWALGDLAGTKVAKTYGEDALGKFASEIGMARAKTLYEYRRISGRYQNSIRMEFSEALTWSHFQAATRAGDLAEEFLARAADEGWPVAELARQIDATMQKATRDVMVAIADGQYSVIYADPPWRYEHIETENRAIENHYPTMELADICALPVGGLAAEDAVLFMWATSPKLAEAMQVVEAWGFNYRTSMVWVKHAIGMGYYARQRHELLLIATKGQPRVPPPAARPDSVQEWPRGRHSEKPEVFYELIEQMYPDWPRIELFARARREGWDAWGNEVAMTEECA